MESELKKRGRKPKPSEALVAPDNVLDRIEALLSPKQRGVLHDTSRFILARCSRRAGKTYFDAVKLIHTSLQHPGDTSVYFGLTKASAKEAIWDELLKMLTDLAIPHSYSEVKLEITIGNGARVMLIGADMENIKNRMRGRKFRLAIIDECAFFYSVDNFILSVLQPTLADYAGTMLMTSSPGILPKGLFYEADEGVRKAEWSRHSWTGGDNPFFQGPAKDPKFANRWEEELDLVVRMQFSGDWQNPTFRREWLGEWTFDSRTLVYPLPDAGALLEEYPMRASSYGMGLNLAVAGRQSACIVKYGEYDREVQIVKAYAFKAKNLDALADEIEGLMEDYEINRVVTYVGEHPKSLVDDFKSRYKLPLTVSRHEKIEYFQQVISTDLEKLHIRPVGSDCAALLDEWKRVVKGDNGEELPDQETLLSDAFFVVYLDVYSTNLKQVEEEVSIEDAMERELIEAFEQERLDYEDMYGQDD